MKAWVGRAIIRISKRVWVQHVVSNLFYRLHQPSLRSELARLKLEIGNKTPNNPVLKGFKVYSETDEDGIIEYILSRIQTNKTFIDIGCGEGIENNTHYLLLKGYTGYWVDGSSKNINFIRNHLGVSLSDSSKLKISREFVEKENIVDVIKDACEFNKTEDPDFFSLDIDGNDLFILEKSLHAFSPRVICVEYNAKFPPPTRLSIVYNAVHAWTGDDYQGATLQMICDCLEGYRLVSCNISGANAFFVRNDLAEPFAQYSTEELFQPARYDLACIFSGHPHSFKWLKNVLSER